ncbi:MAG: manganese efflux pump MntP family protein [Atopobiaceae bacterium]|jgi:putative Mn2+ efflux pump MntP|nr:manganese efflux pump MntP family protein [Atopobiaceae bacterium]MCI2173460.1 manganese efflux pump MntP family protein [Atopobiaceae bacterium]MCI2207455.1 manganese efflux pump MntP family protein [Atopobiaceae bacterium]
MGFAEIVILGLALSCDAFAVTISNTFVYCHETRARLALMPVLFGLFQGLMPLVGYFLGGLAADLIETYSGIVTLVILGVIGGNMIREGVGALRHPEEKAAGEACVTGRLTIAALLFQAVATAIDAFAVGVSLRAQSVDILVASGVIALTTALCCVVALVIGRKLGHLLGDRAEVAGGVVLVIIGLKAFLS